MNRGITLLVNQSDAMAQKQEIIQQNLDKKHEQVIEALDAQSQEIKQNKKELAQQKSKL